MTAAIGLGLLGVGTVGSAVVRALAERATYLEKTTGRSFEIRKALVQDLTKVRDVPLEASTFTSEINEVLLDDSIDIVVELMGGVEPANSYLRRAIESGKHVVTANKEVMATHGVELMALAAASGRDLYFEASVGGGIPLIGPFRQDLAANQIREVHAILNGTTNYILTKMSSGDADYKSALAEAQHLGYAEPEPENDVGGHDSAYKLAILASLAFKSDIRPQDVFREGITNLTPADFRHAAELGYSIKLLAIAKADADDVEVRVHPTLVQKDFLLGQVDGVFNAVRLDGDLLGRAMFIGRGAGPEPTSSAIVADLIDLGHNIHRNEHNRIPLSFSPTTRVRPIAAVRSRYYFRVWVQDHPGVLAQIGTVCGEESVSIASVIQKEIDETAGRAELVFLTHEADESSAQQAITRIAELEVVAEVASCIRVEDLAE